MGWSVRTDRSYTAEEPLPPGAEKQYGLIWRDWLDGGQIGTVTWSVPAPLEVVDSGTNGSAMTIQGVTYPARTIAWVRLRGAVASGVYRCVCTVTRQVSLEVDRATLIVLGGRL